MFRHIFTALLLFVFFFFFNDTATTDIYTLSLHDALPIVMTLIGTPPISFGTKSSELRSGMPSAAAGPVVVMEMPTVISLVCAIVGAPIRASAATTDAADRKAFFIHSSLGLSIYRLVLRTRFLYANR